MAKLILNVFWVADVVQGGSICRCILLHNFLWICAFTWSLEWSNILSTVGMPSRSASFHNQRKCREKDLIYSLRHPYLVDERTSSLCELNDVCFMVESPVVFSSELSVELQGSDPHLMFTSVDVISHAREHERAHGFRSLWFGQSYDPHFLRGRVMWKAPELVIPGKEVDFVNVLRSPSCIWITILCISFLIFVRFNVQWILQLPKKYNNNNKLIKMNLEYTILIAWELVWSVAM